MQSQIPVSYTHLDVYKRQRKDSKKGSENRQKSGDRERNVAHPNGEEHSRVPKGNGVKHLTETPVSYTHLDVYKRQI